MTGIAAAKTLTNVKYDVRKREGRRPCGTLVLFYDFQPLHPFQPFRNGGRHPPTPTTARRMETFDFGLLYWGPLIEPQYLADHVLEIRIESVKGAGEPRVVWPKILQ